MRANSSSSGYFRERKIRSPAYDNNGARFATASRTQSSRSLPSPDIGDYLGLTLETVSRALSQLHAQGVLGFSGARQIVLRNRQRLHNMDA